MKSKILLLVFCLLAIFIFSSCAVSESVWSQKENKQDSLRQIIGLPSIAVGNLNPAVRNPGVEFLCTGLYDTPGGYCSYFTDGVPFVASPINANITKSDYKK